MATEKTLKTRVKMKHGKESEWALATKFTPLIGEIIVYDADNNHTSPRFKVGDGLTNVNNLKFVNQDELAKITTLRDELLAVKNGYVPNTRTINSKPLSANISLTASDVGAAASSHTHSYLPLTGGTLTGSLTVNDNIYGKGTLISQKNSYPGLTIQNTSGANLAMLYSNGATGGYSNVGLRVYSSASEYSIFSFENDGSLDFEGRLYSGNHTIKGDSYPSLIFANAASSKSLAYIQYQTNSGDYGDLQIAVKNSSSGIAYFTFKNSGIFVTQNDIIANGGVLKSSKNSSPSIALTNASGAWLAYLAAETTDGSYGNAKLRVNKSATEGATFTFGNNGNINVPGTVNLGSALSISSGGTGATSAASALANLGAASSTLIRGQMKTFTIAGDKNHYYPVVFSVRSEYFVNRIAITRGYSDTAPNDWGTDTNHKGGLTFQFQWNGDGSWGGNGTSTSLKVETLIETYCKMVGGMKLSTSGVVVWLRGGSASYKVLNEMGSAISITPYYDTFTDDDRKSFPVRTYDASVVDNEIQQRLVFYPLTGGNLLGKLYASGEISGTQLYSKTNNYPEVHFKNAAGTTLAEFYVDTTSGGYADTVLKVSSDASTGKYFVFGRSGVFGIPNGFSAPMGEFKSNAYPQLFFRNANGNNLAQLVVPTDNGSYSGLAVNVYSDANTSVEYKFNSDGTFKAPFAVQAARTYVRTNNYPELIFQNANGVTLAELYANTDTGAYAPIVLRVKQSVNGFREFTFGNDGKLSCGSLALATALPISSGGTGSTTASGALANLGALPLSGGTITGSLIVNTITTSNYFQTDNEFVNLGEDQNGEYGIINLGNTNYGDWISLTCSATGKLAVDNKMVYTAGGTVIYSSTQPTGSTGMIWLKPV